MLPTILICLVLAGLALLAIRRLRKKGSCDCASCDSAAGCPHAKANK